MKAQEIRDHFIKYFTSKDHQLVASSSLVPHNDPTLLFANAGMNQFKNYFTGIEKPTFKRAVSIQKCVRAGGKHNDLENVGCTARHHTFFEMLGNFSFGDYFKKEAIEYAWEFLTTTLAIPKDRLYVTVHHSDDEAYDLWTKKIAIPKERIFRKGDKDNFWSMGDTGPCGPCSEIFYDHGPAFATPGLVLKKDQDILDDEQRFVEIWNLVFMQFEQTKSGRQPLPCPSIDTGAGLERITAVLQNVYWNYDTDLFQHLIKKIEEITKFKYSDPKYVTSIRIVADHVRSCSLLISDGVLPSNEGKGYVLRRIIRRATRHLRNLNAPKNSLALLSQTLFEEMKQPYPENYSNRQLAFEMLASEEEKFLETLDNGLKYLKNALHKEEVNNVFSGKAAFQLYDTFGFPLDLTQSILKEKNITVDIDAFDSEMEKRKENSRNSWKGQLNLDEKIFYDFRAKHGATHFVGYDQISSAAQFLDSFQIDEDKFGLIFDKTPFYGESGGQVGDTGTLKCGDQIYQIIDTLKPINDLFVHIINGKPLLPAKSNCELTVDHKKRNFTAANHTATHLLHKVLAQILGGHVKQAGSFVSTQKLRFDYTHMKSPSKKELQQIENEVNRLIQSSLPVTASHSSYKEAIKAGAMALFGEKYGDKVRVIKIENESIELCGGTHVKNTFDISCFKIVTEGALSTGTRRIEALTSIPALNYLYQRSDYLSSLENLMKDKAENIEAKIEKMNADIRKKNKEISKLQSQLNSKASEDLFANPQNISNNFCFKSAEVPVDSDMKNLSDLFLDKFSQGFLLLYSKTAPQSSMLLRGPRNLKKINLNQVIKSISPLGNIRGGGRPDMIQGKVDTTAINDVATAIMKQLNDQLGD